MGPSDHERRTRIHHISPSDARNITMMMFHGVDVIGSSVAVVLAMVVVAEVTVAFVDSADCDAPGSAGFLKLNSDSMGCLFTISLNRTLSQIGVHVCCAFTKNGLASNSSIYWHVVSNTPSRFMATATSPAEFFFLNYWNQKSINITKGEGSGWAFSSILHQ